MTIKEDLHKNPLLQTYVKLLQKWNTRINLVGKSTLKEVWERHIADSAQLVPFLGKSEIPLVDVGSGSGLPGIVLGILSQRKIICVESDQRKGIFLETVLRQLSLDGVVHMERVETLTFLGAPEVIVCSRAFKPLQTALKLLKPHFGTITKYLTLKGKEWEDEVKLANRTFEFDIEVYPSLTHPQGKILELTALQCK
jgi:16S rRNA (guanine527-N7)-methyltransferase